MKIYILILCLITCFDCMALGGEGASPEEESKMMRIRVKFHHGDEDGMQLGYEADDEREKESILKSDHTKGAERNVSGKDGLHIVTSFRDLTLLDMPNPPLDAFRPASLNIHFPSQLHDPKIDKGL